MKNEAMCPVAGAQCSMYTQDMCAMYSYNFPKMVFTHKDHINFYILDAQMHLTEGLTGIKHEQNKLKTEPPSIVGAFAGLGSTCRMSILTVDGGYIFCIRPHLLNLWKNEE